MRDTRQVEFGTQIQLLRIIEVIKLRAKSIVGKEKRAKAILGKKKRANYVSVTKKVANTPKMEFIAAIILLV